MGPVAWAVVCASERSGTPSPNGPLGHGPDRGTRGTTQRAAQRNHELTSDSRPGAQPRSHRSAPTPEGAVRESALHPSSSPVQRPPSSHNVHRTEAAPQRKKGKTIGGVPIVAEMPLFGSGAQPHRPKDEALLLCALLATRDSLACLSCVSCGICGTAPYVGKRLANRMRNPWQPRVMNHKAPAALTTRCLCVTPGSHARAPVPKMPLRRDAEAQATALVLSRLTESEPSEPL